MVDVPSFLLFHFYLLNVNTRKGEREMERDGQRGGGEREGNRKEKKSNSQNGNTPNILVHLSRLASPPRKLPSRWWCKNKMNTLRPYGEYNIYPLSSLLSVYNDSIFTHRIFPPFRTVIYTLKYLRMYVCTYVCITEPLLKSKLTLQKFCILPNVSSQLARIRIFFN